MSKFKHSTDLGDVKGNIEFEDGMRGWSVTQDITPYLKDAKEQRDIGFDKKIHYRKFASIPDVVAIEVMNKYGINIHDPEVAGDKWEMKKFKDIIIKEYPYLVVST